MQGRIASEKKGRAAARPRRRGGGGWRWVPLPVRRWSEAELAPIARQLTRWPLLLILLVGLLTIVVLAQFPRPLAIDLGGDRNSVRDRADVGRDDDFLFLRDGFHDPEMLGNVEFRWTTAEARIALPAVSGQAAWTATLHLAGGRPSGVPNPIVEVFIDGRLAMRTEVNPAFADYTFTFKRDPLPPTDATMVIKATTFTPQGDPRDLGVMIDRFTLAPVAGAGPYFPPPLYLATIVGLFLLGGALLASVGVPLWPTAGTFAVGFGLLAYGEWRWTAMTARYLPGLLLVAATLFVARLLLLPLVRKFFALGRVPLTPRDERLLFGVFLCGAAIHLAGVFYPPFSPHDLGFQVNRLTEVLNGKFFLSAVSLEWGNRRTPYPPALYYLVAPFAWAVNSPALALRLLTPIIDATSAFLVFYLLRRVGAPEPAPLLAALFATLVPASFQLLWWAFYPNLFGQWATLLVITLLVAHYGELRRPWLFGGLVAALSVTLLAHPGTFVLTMVLVPLLALVLPLARVATWRDSAAALGALALSFAIVYALYYWYFTDMLIDQVRATVEGTVAFAAERGWEWNYIRLRLFDFPYALYFSAALVAGVALARARNILGWAVLAIIGTTALFATLHVVVGVWVRYFVFASPALAIGLGVALAWALGRGKWWRVGGYAVLAGCAIFSLSTWFAIVVIGVRSVYP